MNCTLCPQNCNIDREMNKGFCGVTNRLKAARAALHFWEEPCISGKSGSGAVFFSGCPLHCVFCQNSDISNGDAGKEISVERLAEIFTELQQKGANNINLVTPTHYVPEIIEAIKLARKNGLSLPIVYNSSGYEKVHTLKLLEGYVDVYLPDMKYFSPFLSKKYSGVSDYFAVAKDAIAEMYRQVGAPVFDESEIIKSGVIVRHLVLPSHSDDSKRVINYLYSTYKDNIYISIMNQFTPNEKCRDFSELNRTLNKDEYESVVNYAVWLGVKNGFTQEGGTASESFIPAFDLEGV